MCHVDKAQRRYRPPISLHPHLVIMPSARGSRRYRGRFRFIPRIRGRHAIYFRANHTRLRRRRRTATSFKRRQVYISRQLVRRRALLRTRHSNYVLKQYKRNNIYEMNAKSFAAVKGVKHIPLTLAEVMLPDDLSYIQNCFGQTKQ